MARWHWASIAILGICLRGGAPACMAAEASADSRIRTVVYAADEVYRLRGYVGYQIDLEFAPGESFLGLGAGDVESLSFGAQGNHLFLKPRAAGVATNLTIITSARTYHVDYQASDRRPDPAGPDVVYVLRFVYAPLLSTPSVGPSIEQSFERAIAARPHNMSYGYRGSSALKPLSAWDDGVQTHLVFGSRQELPAIFAHNEDGSESLVNLSVNGNEVTVHRISPELQLRRGGIAGCIVNEAFSGSGAQLRSGTIAPAVEREARSVPP